ncbi:DNA methylase N-4/N-6 domain-containing protein [Moraxella macacae 0408225]|uniref:Methyltransferase n=1 Tax=Moraxella macacae 0408225 TaxID=1230338 RepID=L2F796_9GAMM|nr:site-specific DNA-methyltransferase [Moraxella macacae]ELA08907.1 DNA methylase N-4/N-6 domain-containing protein [Moraxella macacae 0408225]
MPTAIHSFLNTILQGDCIENLKKLPSNSIDLIFADPPYFMQTEGQLLRTSGEKFAGVEDEWDKFNDFAEYDAFCTKWLSECQRILKPTGSIWVIGSFQNIYRIGYLMQNLGFWILNDVVWHKTNPVPNFGGTRFCNAHETLLWCSKTKNSKFTFNYKTMKHLNGDKQERSVWQLALCTGSERIKGDDGKKVHSTQKPEALLYKVILASSKPNDIVLDPFFGTGTTGAVAKALGRNYIGLERESKYIDVAQQRLAQVVVNPNDIEWLSLETKPPKVAMKTLVAANYLNIGQALFDKNQNRICTVLADGKVTDSVDTLSIHKMSAKYLNKTNHNGWDYFYVIKDNKLITLDSLRYDYASKMGK